MRNVITFIIILALVVVSGSLYYTLYLDYVELQQHYEWALEISKIPTEERKEIILEVKNKMFV